MENIIITVRLAEPLRYLSRCDGIQSHIIEVSKADSIQYIIELAMKACYVNYSETNVTEECRKREYCLKIESIDGKTFQEKILNEKNIHELKRGKINFLRKKSYADSIRYLCWQRIRE